MAEIVADIVWAIAALVNYVIDMIPTQNLLSYAITSYVAVIAIPLVLLLLTLIIDVRRSIRRRS